VQASSVPGAKEKRVHEMMGVVWNDGSIWNIYK